MLNLETPEIQAMLKKSVATVIQKSPRYVKVIHDGREAQIRIGVNDGKLRVDFNGLVDEYASQTSAIDDALAFVDGDYNERRFQAQAAILAEGEADDEN